VHSHQPDQSQYLGLGAAEQDRAAAYSQPPCQHGQVEHQGRVREHELAQIDDDITLRADRANQCLSSTSLRCPVLVSAAAQSRGRFIKSDDGRNLPKTTGPSQGDKPSLLQFKMMVTVDEVTDALRDVIDPELGLDFVELGLIYEVEIEEDATVRVTYTLTSPGCPIGPQVSEQIQEFVGELEGVSEVEPTMTFSPPWTPERMSEDAKFALGF
jgi:metal-sulfur cluster biosynthetic enzyme